MVYRVLNWVLNWVSNVVAKGTPHCMQNMSVRETLPPHAVRHRVSSLCTEYAGSYWAVRAIATMLYALKELLVSLWDWKSLQHHAMQHQPH